MKQNQKGITIVGLLVTVIVIVTIAGVCIYTGKDIIEEAKLQQIKTNMLLIQAKSHFIEDKVTAGEDTTYIGTIISDGDERYAEYNITQTDPIKFYELSAEDVKNDVGLGEIAVNDGDYLVDYETSEVIYTKGYNGKYKLSEILETNAE